MKAAVASETGLVLREVPVPEAGPGQVLVKVSAAGLNRADLNAAKGAGISSSALMGEPIGMEWSGYVEACGPGVSPSLLGARVMCFGRGGYAEYAVCDVRHLVRLDAAKIDHVNAAVLPVALLTMHNALVTVGRLAAGESILLQGASSGVGLMGLLLARHFRAGLVLASSTSADRRARLEGFGADAVLDSRDPKWPDTAKAITKGRGVDLIIDMVSAGAINGNMEAAAVAGRVINVGRLGGVTDSFDFDLHARKRIHYEGVTFRTRSAGEIARIVESASGLVGEIEAGNIRLPIDRVFALDAAADAHAHMRSNAHFGKIALSPTL